MPYGLVNLTLPVVIQEIENALEEYPEYPYRVAFSIPELRQKLIAHILSHVPNRYTVEGEWASSGNHKGHHSSSLQERLHRETVIHGSILHILRENASWLSHHLPNLDLN